MPWYEAVLVGLGAWFVVGGVVAYAVAQLLAP
jgi:hypothetical protein